MKTFTFILEEKVREFDKEMIASVENHIKETNHSILIEKKDNWIIFKCRNPTCKFEDKADVIILSYLNQKETLVKK